MTNAKIKDVSTTIAGIIIGMWLGWELVLAKIPEEIRNSLLAATVRFIESAGPIHFMGMAIVFAVIVGGIYLFKEEPAQ